MRWRPQDGLYTLVTLDAEISYQVIGALARNPRRSGGSPARPAAAGAPPTRVVTITVTEKGYCLTPDGGLDVAHPDIVRDLRDPRAPRQPHRLPGRGVGSQRRAGGDAPTIISCDNLVDNGARLGRAVVQLPRMRDSRPRTLDRGSRAFPRTMVDSITPATTDALRERVSATAGFADRWPVQRERFVQWVMEDRLRRGRSGLAAAGVT